jgi:arylsulfatase
MVDDMGYADLGCYGGEIRTPNIDALAKGGVRWRNFYNCAQCCPTRASLMSGLYPHQAGVGEMIDPSSKPIRDAASSPAYSDHLDTKTKTMAEVLKAVDYQTYMVGKWHLGYGDGHRPTHRGFDRYFGIIAGADNYFKPTTLRSQDEPLKQVRKDFYTTDDFTTKAIEFIEKGDEKKPFFLYAAYNAPHTPFHARPKDIEKYKDVYNVGWDSIRERRFARQKELGFWPQEMKLSPHVMTDAKWTGSDAQRKTIERMQTYAAMVDRVDQNVGRIVEALKKRGKLDNTLILFLSDNGAWASPSTYGREWAEAGNTPFRLYKVHVHEGGSCSPLIAHWPNGIPKADLNTRAYGHVKDIMATCLEAAGAPCPSKESRSLLKQLRDPNVAEDVPLLWERRGHEAVREGPWKLVRCYSTPAGENVNGDNKGKRMGAWELYDLGKDPAECNNLAAGNPERVRAMADRHAEWFKRIGGVDRELINTK